eukprot:g14722.t1
MQGGSSSSQQLKVVKFDGSDPAALGLVPPVFGQIQAFPTVRGLAADGGLLEFDADPRVVENLVAFGTQEVKKKIKGMLNAWEKIIVPDSTCLMIFDRFILVAQWAARSIDHPGMERFLGGVSTSMQASDEPESSGPKKGMSMRMQQRGQPHYMSATHNALIRRSTADLQPDAVEPHEHQNVDASNITSAHSHKAGTASKSKSSSPRKTGVQTTAAAHGEQLSHRNHAHMKLVRQLRDAEHEIASLRSQVGQKDSEVHGLKTRLEASKRNAARLQQNLAEANQKYEKISETEQKATKLLEKVTARCLQKDAELEELEGVMNEGVNARRQESAFYQQLLDKYYPQWHAECQRVHHDSMAGIVALRQELQAANDGQMEALGIEEEQGNIKGGTRKQGAGAAGLPAPFVLESAHATLENARAFAAVLFEECHSALAEKRRATRSSLEALRLDIDLLTHAVAQRDQRVAALTSLVPAKVADEILLAAATGGRGPGPPPLSPKASSSRAGGAAAGALSNPNQHPHAQHHVPHAVAKVLKERLTELEASRNEVMRLKTELYNVSTTTRKGGGPAGSEKGAGKTPRGALSRTTSMVMPVNEAASILDLMSSSGAGGGLDARGGGKGGPQEHHNEHTVFQGGLEDADERGAVREGGGAPSPTEEAEGGSAARDKQVRFSEGAAENVGATAAGEQNVGGPPRLSSEEVAAAGANNTEGAAPTGVPVAAAETAHAVRPMVFMKTRAAGENPRQALLNRMRKAGLLPPKEEDPTPGGKFFAAVQEATAAARAAEEEQSSGAGAGAAEDESKIGAPAEGASWMEAVGEPQGVDPEVDAEASPASGATTTRTRKKKKKHDDAVPLQVHQSHRGRVGRTSTIFIRAAGRTPHRTHCYWAESTSTSPEGHIRPKRSRRQRCIKGNK